MSLVLDPAIEQRLQRQLESGSYSGPDELLAHALDLLEAETGPEDWLSANKEAVRAMIEESVAAEAKGVSYSMEEAEAILAQRRAAHPLTHPL
jgi:Arc/MetJ-type ribon-helix-helix transcriptional regulator